VDVLFLRDNNLVRKTERYIYFLLLLTVVSSTCSYAQNLTNTKDVMEYEITIVTKYFGRPNNRIIVTGDSLSYEKKVHMGNSEKKVRLLTKEEKESMERFLKDFPIDELEESYYTDMVKDGTQMTFAIKINDKIKETFIGNVYQENLGELVALIVPMLPEDLIQYKKELIYPYK
jgi:hypothetical protein